MSFVLRQNKYCPTPQTPPSPLQSLLEKSTFHFSANETLSGAWAGRVTIKLSLLGGKVYQCFLNQKHSIYISYFDITLKTYLVLHVTA